MNKNISLSVFILSILLTVLVVFMTTYVALSEVFRDKYGELAKDLAQGSGTVIADSNMTPDDKLDIIKSLFQLYSYYDLEDDALTDGALKGLAQGTGDRYAEYYTEEEFSAMTDDSNGDMQGIGISIIHNNCFEYCGYGICGTRGWVYDGTTQLDNKVIARECGRLEASIVSAEEKGLVPIVFLHYPPKYKGYDCHEILDLLKQYDVRRCFWDGYVQNTD